MKVQNRFRIIKFQYKSITFVREIYISYLLFSRYKLHKYRTHFYLRKRFVNMSKMYISKKKYMRDITIWLWHSARSYLNCKTVQVYSRTCRAIKQVGTFVLSNHNVDAYAVQMRHLITHTDVMNERVADAWAQEVLVFLITNYHEWNLLRYNVRYSWRSSHEIYTASFALMYLKCWKIKLPRH